MCISFFLCFVSTLSFWPFSVSRLSAAIKCVQLQKCISFVLPACIYIYSCCICSLSEWLHFACLSNWNVAIDLIPSLNIYTFKPLASRYSRPQFVLASTFFRLSNRVYSDRKLHSNHSKLHSFPECLPHTEKSKTKLGLLRYSCM